MKSQKGFGIIEVIVAMALFITVAVVGITTVVGSFSVNRLGNEETEATLYAQQGIEAVRSIKNQGWTAPFLATSCASGCGVSADNSSWEWSGLSNTNGDYTRTISVTNVERDGNGDIVENGGTNDPDTKKIISTVTWNFTPTRNNTLTLETYLTNFRKAIVGDWSSPQLQGSVNISGNQNALKVATSGNYAYVVLAGGNPDFVVIDVSNLASPVVIGSLNLAGNPTDVEVSGNYAYVSSSDNSNELIVINVANPSSPAVVGSYNAQGNANANAVSVSGNRVYLARASSNQDEFIVLSITSPNSPSLLGSLNLGANANEVFVSGDYAYVATDSNSAELQIVNISNPSIPSIAGTYDSSGNQNGESVTGFGTTIILGLLGNGDIEFINASNPASPSQISLYNGSDDVRDTALGNSNEYLFIATDANSAELQILDISNISAPVLLGSYDTSGNNDLNGVVYASSFDRVFAVGDSNSEEFIILSPQ